MHFRTLGFWRVAAAMMVMVFHFLNYGPESAVEMTDRLRALAPLLDMFMMISGFLIMFRYIDRLLVEPGSYVRFIWRRLARFYPLYFLTLLYFVMVGVAVHLGLIGSAAVGRYDFSALPANLLLVQGWGFTDTLTFNYVAWTLSAEWFCYLALPVIVVTYRRLGVPGLIALLAVTLAALEIATATGVMPFSTWMAADTWGAYRAFADFAIGALVAVAVRDSRWRLKSHWVGWAAFAATVVAMWNGLGGYPAFALLAVSIFLAALAERNNQDATLFLRPLDAVANASFSIYLIHPVIASLLLGIVWRHFLEPADMMGFYIYWIIPMAASVALSVASSKYFEVPLGNVLNGWFANVFPLSRKLSRAL
jgi:peptidoglycan/LPS O-acetylase OafA/YrhL